ncbi:hypothetical protein FHEFKHOI_00623 [Candidatus Methanoperedenaceae archaeon GB50]|nr:hypothetical protein AIOGIFDO_00621 [Candidatus Methanoperedenaceae archaeon GB37]CAD7769549.1 hypothetical protein FHEFKHOI_00623 [Candidatus Methanoperedenaceae archaeon GB50]CAD7778551.1 MAG: hypothetical protein KBONHNOK_01166 [Candidatus Methanoperedenaceae archaeon GB50]
MFAEAMNAGFMQLTSKNSMDSEGWLSKGLKIFLITMFICSKVECLSSQDA